MPTTDARSLQGLVKRITWGLVGFLTALAELSTNVRTSLLVFAESRDRGGVRLPRPEGVNSLRHFAFVSAPRDLLCRKLMVNV